MDARFRMQERIGKAGRIALWVAISQKMVHTCCVG
jgi:hypothetical protein